MASDIVTESCCILAGHTAITSIIGHNDINSKTETMDLHWLWAVARGQGEGEGSKRGKIFFCYCCDAVVMLRAVETKLNQNYCGSNGLFVLYLILRLSLLV